MFAAVAVGLLASCGGNKAESSSAEEQAALDTTETEMTEAIAIDTNTPQEEYTVGETVEEEPEDESGWKPPFQFQTTWQYSQSNDEYRYVTTYKLLANGKLKVTVTKEEKSVWGDDNAWELKTADTKEYGGKWSTTSISRGEGRQKVYVIDRSDYENSLYLPDDMEYFWNAGSPLGWVDCENYDTSKAVKVEKPKKL